MGVRRRLAGLNSGTPLIHLIVLLSDLELDFVRLREAVAALVPQVEACSRRSRPHLRLQGYPFEHLLKLHVFIQVVEH